MAFGTFLSAWFIELLSNNIEFYCIEKAVLFIVWETDCILQTILISLSHQSYPVILSNYYHNENKENNNLQHQ